MKKSFIQRAALESIDFQESLLFKELVIGVAQVREVSKKNLADSQELTSLAKIVQNRTGLKITFEIAPYGPAVDIPPMHKNNVLVNNMIRNFISSNDGMQMINNADKVISGTVDLKKSVVSGVFCDVPLKIYMPESCFTGSKFTDEEVAAVILHEIGHPFTFFEFMASTASTNQVLAGTAKALDGSNDITYRETVLLSVKKKLGLKNLDAQLLAKSTNNKAVEAAIISNISEESASQLERSVYDLSSWEYLADQFAARHGAARHLATALAKLYTSSYNISFRSSIGFLAIEALKLAMLAFVPALGVLLIAMDSQGDGTYDVPGARLKRVRNQVIENLKDKDLPKEDVERLKADLVTIDSILAGVDDRRQFFGVLADFFVPGASKDRAYTKLQQELESLAANDLFAKSAELRLMA